MFCIILGFIFGRKGEKRDGLPHRRVRRCAMTGFLGNAVHIRRRGVVTPPYGGQEVPTAGRRGRRLPTGAWLSVRCIRDDVGIVPYGVGKTPVGRGQCAPPLGVQYMSAAAHMGAALQRNL